MSSFIRLFSCLILILLASCEKKPKEDNCSCLKINLQEAPTSLEPQHCRNLSSLFLARALHEGLFRFENETIVQGICESYTVSDQKDLYYFNLKQAHYSDGSCINAQDIRDAILNALDPKSSCDYSYLLYCIKNAENFHKGLASQSEVGIKVLSSHELEIALAKSDENFIALLTHPIFFPYKKGLFTGPFKLENYLPGDHIKLVKNPFYHKSDDVKLQALIGKFVSSETACVLFDQKELDFIGSPISSLPLEALSRYSQTGHLCKTPLLGMCFLRVNTKHPKLHNASFRRLLSQSISRQLITELALQNYHAPSQTLVPAQMGLGSHLSKIENKSFSISSESSSEPIRLKFSKQDARMQKVACVIKNTLENVLKLHIELVPSESKMLFDDLKQSKYDLMMGSWLADINDPLNFLELFADKNLSVNGTGWENETYSNLLSLAKEDPSKRINSLKEAENILLEESPIIPLFQFNMIYAKEKKLKGYSLNSLGILDFKKASFN